MIKVHIYITDWFKRFTSGKREFEIEVPESSTAIQAVMFTGIPAEEVGFVTVNNVKVNPDYVLTDGDYLRVYNVIIGG